MGRFKCIKCGTGITTSSHPSGNCPKGGVHRWVNDNYTTSQRWKCSKCGNGTTSISHPLVGTCFKGGGHSWRKA
jgi:DNA-directed RNA polymerase subunit RPC12/RpoP